MTIAEIVAVCEAEIIALPEAPAVIAAAYASDLLSDVMAHAPPGAVLITVQNHLNTVAVATLVDIRAILVCHNRGLPDDMIAAARREEIALLRTSLDQFHACCRLAALAAPAAH